MRKFGYARVSSSHQNLDRQLGALRAERVDVIYREKASGKATKGRPELEKALDQLGKGDSSSSPNGTAPPARCSTGSTSSSAFMPGAPS